MHPDRIGPYLIDKRIGAGGMGNVYLGKHEQTGQVVAVKELPASLAREEGFVHRFNREIEAMRKLSCPYIVQLYDNGADGEIYYYSMEYVDGETLTSRLRRERRIPWEEAVELSRQICVGLKHAHDAGVVHRDLKPSNLMLDKQGNIKITDFGVAQVFASDRLTSTGGVIGTAEFMSPEQVTGSRTDKRSDLYSLGAVLYTMLVGQPPFVGPTASDIMQKQRFGRFDPPKNYLPELPRWLDELTCQLLEKEPDKRPPDAFVTMKRLQQGMRKLEIRETGVGGWNSDQTRADSQTPHDHMGGTFVRDLMRLEASSQLPATWIQRAFNNTWVLVGTLFLVLFGAGWLLWHSPETTDSSDVASSSLGESERIIQSARWKWKGGDPRSALRQLDALQAIIQHDRAHQTEVTAIDRLRTAINRQTKTPDQPAFIERAFERAESLTETDRDEAIRIYQGIITLYQDDQRLNDLIDRARAKLESLGDLSEK